MISLMLCSRYAGKDNIGRLVKSLIENTKQLDDIDLIIKLDDDDISTAVPHAPFNIVTFSSPRGRGYAGLHTGYLECLQFIDDRTDVIGAIADDFTAEKDWDERIRSCERKHPDYFIIHGRKNTIPVSKNIENIKDVIVDEAPFWSRKLLMRCGCNWAVSFTDAWTIAIERMLQNRGIDITTQVPKLFHRHINPETDYKDSERWNGVRKDNFNYINSSFFLELVNAQADNIARFI